MTSSKTDKWPKVLPPLSTEHKRIHDAFMQQWHVELAGRSRYNAIEKFNHEFPVKFSRAGFISTLEIGSGLGEHLKYEHLTPEQRAHYYANEFRERMAAEVTARYPDVHVLVHDCQQPFDFPDGSFDRIIAVHVLEHLPNLPATVREAYRLLDNTRGQLLIVIPCEGGAAYTLARRMSAQRIFEKTYKLPYDPFIKREHINLPAEIFAELDPFFEVVHRRFFPFPFVPLIACNLVIGVSLRPRAMPAVRMPST